MSVHSTFSQVSQPLYANTLVINSPIFARIIRILPTRINGTLVAAFVTVKSCSPITKAYEFPHNYSQPGSYNVTLTGTNSAGSVQVAINRNVIVPPGGVTFYTPRALVYQTDSQVNFTLQKGTNVYLAVTYDNQTVPISFQPNLLVGNVMIPASAFDRVGNYTLSITYGCPITNPIVASTSGFAEIFITGLVLQPSFIPVVRNQQFNLTVYLNSGVLINIIIDWNDTSYNSKEIFQVTENLSAVSFHCH